MLKFMDLQAQNSRYNDGIAAAFSTILEHQQFVNGPECIELESSLCRWAKAKHCLVVSSGTDALVCSLLAAGVKKGDEVITASLSFAATVEAILLVGATPVYVDCKQDEANLDEAEIKKLISPKTKAILSVSLYGIPGNLLKIREISDEHGLVFIEDASQSFGSSIGKNISGAIADYTVTSFYPSKPLGASGNLGAVFSLKKESYENLKAVRCHGQKEKYWHEKLGWNAMPSSLQAASVSIKLNQYEKIMERRNCCANIYIDEIQKRDQLKNVTLPKVDKELISNWCYFVIRVPNRDSLVKKCFQEGLQLLVHYPHLLPENPAFRGKGLNEENLQNGKGFTQSIVSLPLYDGLNEESQFRALSILEKSLSATL